MRPEEERFIYQIYMDNFSTLKRYANIHLNPIQAEEVVQDTFWQAIEKSDALLQYENPSGWLMNTLKYKIRNLKRANQKELLRLISLDCGEVLLLSDFKSAEDVAMQNEALSTAVQKIQNALSKEELYLLKRFAFDSATHRELAQELGISVWACQKRLERIRTKLGELFPEHKRKK